jgi:hypothetical protein
LKRANTRKNPTIVGKKRKIGEKHLNEREREEKEKSASYHNIII